MSEVDTDSISDLKNLIDLDDGIISTFSAQDLEDNPFAVEDSYQEYASTHISMGDTAEFEDNIKKGLLEDDHPTKGFLYAPFGYGKTSTSVNIWANLTGQNIIVVPPFTFGTFSDLIQATYSWMRFVFEREAPDYTDKLEDIYDEHLQHEADDLKEELEESIDDIDGDALQRVLSEMEDKANIDYRIDPVALSDFFNDCTELAIEAGYDGLVVLPDELQQYFKGANSRQEAEEAFRDFVFDLQAGASISDRFGFVVSMPDSTKSTLDSQAGDVIQRLQNDNITINLKTVYGQDFPRNLWNRYAKEFGFEHQKHEVIPEETLDSIGQICVRQDLSAGPRTVIDLIRIGLTDYLNNGDAFTPVDLADAFYEGRVRYDQNAKIESAIRQGLDHSKVDTAGEQTVIKLCAVYPEEGLPDAVASEYGVLNEYEALQKTLQGPVLTWQTTGYTLSDLDDEDDPFLQQLLRQFWEQFDTDDINAKYAVSTFANRILDGEIFETKRGKLTGWTTEGFEPIEPNVYEAVAEGTFSGQYPERKMKLRVATHETQDVLEETDPQILDGFGTPDIAFDFVLDYRSSADPQIRQRAKGHYLFVLNTSKALDQLPQGMQNLQKSMNPNQVSPFLMLSLISFVDNQNLELDASQEQDLDALTDRLVSEAIKHVFDKKLIQNAPFEIRRAGRRTIEGVFNNAMEELFPKYNTVKMSTQYRDLLDDYRTFLESLDTVSMRQGKITVEDTKKDMADRFSLRGTSAFESRAKKQYSDLLTLKKWEGQDAAVSAKLHPFEEHIVDLLEEEEYLSYEEFQKEAYNQGYRQEELEQIIDLLAARRMVEVDEYDRLTLIKSDISVGEVQEKIETCRDLLDRITKLDGDRAPPDLEEKLDSMVADLEGFTDEDVETLELMDVTVREDIDRLQTIGEDLYRKYKSDCNELKQDFDSLSRGTVPSHVKSDITGAVKFVGNLNDIRNDLRSDYTDLEIQIQEAKDTLSAALSEQSSQSIEDAEQLEDVHASIESDLVEIESEKDELDSRAESLKNWENLTTKVANVKNNIKQSADVFSDEIEELDQIQDTIDNIAEQLTDDPWNAIQNFETYRQQIESVEDAFNSRIRKRREAFDKKKDHLKAALHRATGNKAKGLRRATYDVENPERSQKSLVDQFEEEFTEQVIEGAERRLEKAEQDIKYATIIGVGEINGETPDDVDEEIDVAKTELQSLRSDLTKFSYGQIAPLDESEELEALADTGKTLREKSMELRKKSRRFIQEQPPEDGDLQEILDHIQSERKINFKELIMAYHNDPQKEDMDPETLLKQINELFILNQVDIQIESRGRS